MAVGRAVVILHPPSVFCRVTLPCQNLGPAVGQDWLRPSRGAHHVPLWHSVFDVATEVCRKRFPVDAVEVWKCRLFFAFPGMSRAGCHRCDIEKQLFLATCSCSCMSFRMSFSQALHLLNHLFHRTLRSREYRRQRAKAGLQLTETWNATLICPLPPHPYYTPANETCPFHTTHPLYVYDPLCSS